MTQNNTVHRYKCLKGAGLGPEAFVAGRVYEFDTPVMDYLVRDGYLLPVDDVPAYRSSPSAAPGESQSSTKRRGRPRKDA